MVGIAAYGRDDALGCKAAFYRSQDQGCGYLACFYDRFVVVDALNHTAQLEPVFAPPDWRHCDAAGNYSP